MDPHQGSSPLTRGKLPRPDGALGPRGLIPAHAGKTRGPGRSPMSARAHPRSRGENAAWPVGCGLAGGSSPLTRGKRRVAGGVWARWGLIPAHAGKTGSVTVTATVTAAHPRSRGENRAGICRGRRSPWLIPAHAGKTASSSVWRICAWAHPRSRGENVVCFFVPSAVQGSSPLTRGKLNGVLVSSERLGLIPAHAGKTEVPGLDVGARQGSSPLTRGKRLGGRPLLLLLGLIPAHAGKTARAERIHAETTAHPRSRGENETSAPLWEIGPGSSPLTRGKRAQTRKRHTTHGLIPAHAGKTSSAPRLGVSPRAHPRSRGENPRSSNPTKARPGSSPLTRGKRLARLPQSIIQGLIPAHAGKTRRRIRGRYPHPAHPRSRGENSNPLSFIVRSMGSSPLTRGKHHGERRGRRRWGLIPAHAGKTRAYLPVVGHCKAHPRSRGENLTAHLVVDSHRGSSPLTRGKPGAIEELAKAGGLIPAHAGKTRGGDLAPVAASGLIPAHAGKTSIRSS